MLKLPEEYESKILSMFGADGANWLETIPKVIDKYIIEFGLKELQINEEFSLNLIIYAECEKFGKVVLKIGMPAFRELIYREVEALKAFDGNSACCCYYNNLDDGIRILERLIPGESLRNVISREERIKAFCNVALNLDFKHDNNIQLPSYREILNRTIKISDENQEKFKTIKDLIVIANYLYMQIENSNLPIYLLHADLHHDNILTSGNARKAIDPHGFWGEKVMETARFMENEIAVQEMSKDNILDVIKLMSKYFNEDIALICKSLFIDYVLSTCWDIEMNLGFNHISRDIKNLEIILECLGDILVEEDTKEIVHYIKRK